MSDAVQDPRVELYEHFFRDPKISGRALGPEHSGIACRNIRDALRALKEFNVAEGDHYDDKLKEAVGLFQDRYEHVEKTSRDGLVGRRTRKLLTIMVLEKAGEAFFERGRMSPEFAVFLSYAREDKGHVMRIVEGIKARGIPVFRDQEAIPVGAYWPDVLYRSIRKCQVFLCMLSPHAAESVNVLIEVVLARHAGRPIVPVLLGTAELPGTLRLLVGNIQHLDLSGKHDSDEELRDVLQTLALYGVAPPAQQP